MRFEIDFRILMMGSALAAVLFAALLLGAPQTVAQLFGLALTSTGRLAIRLWGVELLGAGLLCWFLRDLPPGHWRSGLLLAFLLADLVGIVVILHAVLVGLFNAAGWLALGIYLILAALYAHVWFWEGRGDGPARGGTKGARRPRG